MPSYGVNAFDTSAYYGESEIVLGTALKALAREFPRTSYKLVCTTTIFVHPSRPAHFPEITGATSLTLNNMVL